MSVKGFKFVSPGVSFAERDNSQLPKTANPVGPVVFGRTERGPAMKPVTVNSFSDFVEMFGNPVPGGQGNDVWRDGNYMAPTYAAYAAQAWLKNNSPVTVVRLLGAEHSEATDAGLAGWQTTNLTANTGSLAANGGAFGLFIGNSGSATANNDYALAAIFYVNEGSIRLIGDSPDGTAVQGAAVVVKSTGTNYEFKAVVEDKLGNSVFTSSFNFDKNSAIYARKVFNTNPTLTNEDITQNTTNNYGDSQANTLVNYWLGETFERFLTDTVTGTIAAGKQYGVLLSLQSDTVNGANYRTGMQPAKSGWILSQDLTTNTGSYNPADMTKLFRFVTHDNGEWEQKNLKISIVDVRLSNDLDAPYGFFSVEIRKAKDSDNAPAVVERFSSLSLNPASDNYIGKKIGDKYLEWDDTERRYREFGNYDNQSKFVRVEINPDVEAGAVDPRLLPFGFQGVPRFSKVAYTSGSFSAGTPLRGLTDVYVLHSQRVGTAAIDSGLAAFSCSFVFPTMAHRSLSTDGSPVNFKSCYWGVTTNVSSSNSSKFENSYADVVRAKPAGVDAWDADANAATEISTYFSLDDVEWAPLVAGVYTTGSMSKVGWRTGARVAGTSITAGRYYNTTNGTVLSTTASYELVLDAGLNKFTLPLFGGFDGLDITEKEPFRNAQWDGTETELTDYAFNTVKRAIDCVADAEVVDANIACFPGLTNEALTAHLVTVCENRGDMLAIIDLEGGFVPSTENQLGDAAAANRGSVTDTVANLKNRGLNSSYGCSFYPWVQVKDSINGSLLWLPPSVVALGTLGSSETKSELWFAPAGFTRGGLSEGSAGLNVIGVREKLTSTQRDKLYEANINPIASFPNQGIVVFGQKTLQLTPSALDRINVRRLMIYLKKEISRMAATTLFDPNVRVTWNRFLAQAEPFLSSVKTRLGVAEYKIILDETTTTPDLVDRNIMYAKIMVKPVKAIEFIGLDFVITNQGASFED